MVIFIGGFTFAMDTNKNLSDYLSQYIIHNVKVPVTEGDLDTIKSLINRGADIEFKGGYGNRPLHTAAENGLYKVVKLLLEKGAKVNAITNYGQTPLHLATKKGFDEVVKLLLESGADTNAEDKYGNIPLHYAMESLNKNTITYLLKSNPYVICHKNDKGITPMAMLGVGAAAGLIVYVGKLVIKLLGLEDVTAWDVVKGVLCPWTIK